MTRRCLCWILLEIKPESVGEHGGASGLPLIFQGSPCTRPAPGTSPGPGRAPCTPCLSAAPWTALEARGFLNADLQK